MYAHINGSSALSLMLGKWAIYPRGLKTDICFKLRLHDCDLIWQRRLINFNCFQCSLRNLGLAMKSKLVPKQLVNSPIDRRLISNYFDDLKSYNSDSSSKTKHNTFFCLQLLKCDDVLLCSLLNHNELKIFGNWTVGETKQAISRCDIGSLFAIF